MKTRHYSNQGYCIDSHKTVFLAGPTLRNSSNLTPWRQELISSFGLTNDVCFLIPEPTPTEEDQRRYWPNYETQVDWELRHMEIANWIVFWIPRDMKTLPGLTTNVEFGMCIGLDKVIYGRPDNAEHIRYLDYIWEAADHKYPIQKSIPELIHTIKNAIKK